MVIRNMFVVILAILVLSGCATQGERVQTTITYPDGETITIVAHEQSVPDMWLKKSSLKLNYMVQGNVTTKQMEAVARTERGCHEGYSAIVRPSNLVNIVANGLLYGVAGFAGVGLGSQAFAGAKLTEYGLYGLGASGAGGVANGIVSSGGQTYTFESCGREALSIVPQYGVRVLNKSPY